MFDSYDMVYPSILPDATFIGTNFILTPNQTQSTYINTKTILEPIPVHIHIDILCIPFPLPSHMVMTISPPRQVHGGGGVTSDFPLSYAYGYARALRLADGPDEVHNMSVAKLEMRDKN